VPTRGSKDVFVNVPFDEAYEPLFIALIAGLTRMGLTPRSVLEIPPQQDRLTRLKELVKACPYSLHDLSRSKSSRANPIARFNMPFEFGLSLGLRSGRNHRWVVLHSRRFELQEALSDLNGYDPHIHEGMPSKLLRCLLDAFKPGERVTFDSLSSAYSDLKAISDRHLASLVFRPSGFKQLVVAGLEIAAQQPKSVRHRKRRRARARLRRGDE
jgi:hypothetical protein